MACKPHLLKFANHIPDLCDSDTRQTDKHLVHRHLNDRLVKIFLRRHNRHLPNRTALFVGVVDHCRRDIIIPLFALDEISQKLLRHVIECDHQHFLSACTLAVVFPHRFLKNHVQHIGNPNI